MPNLWSSEVSKGHFITSKSGVKSGKIEFIIMFNYEYASIFQEKKTKYTKLLYTQPIYTLNWFQIKIYLESFESIYHLKIFSVKKHPKTKLQRLRKI